MPLFRDALKMESDLNIVIIESDNACSLDLEKRLKALGFSLCRKSLPDESIYQINTSKPGLAILGPSLDADTCFKCIHKLRITDPSIPILTSNGDCLPEEPAFAPFEGVHYLEPEPGEDVISNAIKDSLNYTSMRASVFDCPVIIGQSHGIRSVRRKLRNVADKDITVLLTGETGTGKELLARYIHFHSLRSSGPLVKVDCTTLPDELLESEIFGYQKGAFTDAYKDKPGRLELADKGTLFIDEIGDISFSLQVKFLQLFEDKEFSRLGGTQDRFIDARVLVATNANLQEKVQKGVFRKDLFYRLSVMHMEVPPLRERKEDIQLLTHYFVNKYCFEFKRDIIEIPDKALDFFMAYHWPGNVRELENVVRRAIAVYDWDFVFHDLVLLDVDVQSVDETDIPVDSDISTLRWNEDELKKKFKEKDFSLKKISKAYVAEAEYKAIKTALQKTQWNRTKAAVREHGIFRGIFDKARIS